MIRNILDIPGAAEHFEATAITSPDSFLGKEHLWVAAANTDIPYSHATYLYQAMAFPMELMPNGPDYRLPVKPESLGLLVLSRPEAGVSYPPDALADRIRVGDSVEVRVHQEEFDHDHDDVDLVIHTGSFLGFLDTMKEHSVKGLGPKRHKLARIIGQSISDRF